MWLNINPEKSIYLNPLWIQNYYYLFIVFSLQYRLWHSVLDVFLTSLLGLHQLFCWCGIICMMLMSNDKNMTFCSEVILETKQGNYINWLFFHTDSVYLVLLDTICMLVNHEMREGFHVIWYHQRSETAIVLIGCFGFLLNNISAIRCNYFEGNKLILWK